MRTTQACYVFNVFILLYLVPYLSTCNWLLVLQLKCEISYTQMVNNSWNLCVTYVNKTKIVLLYYSIKWQIKLSFWFFLTNQQVRILVIKTWCCLFCRFKWVFHLCKLNSFHDTILVPGTKDELRSDWWSDLMNTNNCIIVTVNLHWQTLRVKTMLNGKIRDPNPRWTNLKHTTQRKVSVKCDVPYSQYENNRFRYSIWMGALNL